VLTAPGVVLVFVCVRGASFLFFYHWQREGNCFIFVDVEDSCQDHAHGAGTCDTAVGGYARFSGASRGCVARKSRSVKHAGSRSSWVPTAGNVDGFRRTRFPTSHSLLQNTRAFPLATVGQRSQYRGRPERDRAGRTAHRTGALPAAGALSGGGGRGGANLRARGEGGEAARQIGLRSGASKARDSGKGGKSRYIGVGGIGLHLRWFTRLAGLRKKTPECLMRP